MAKSTGDKKQSKKASAATPAKGRQPVAQASSTQHFLYVKVDKDFTKQNIKAAVEAALNAPDVPTFVDRKADPPPTPQSSTGGDQGAGDGLGNALLILVKQEGNP